MDPTMVATILFFPFLYLLIKLYRNSRPNLPPSPPKLPLIGNLHQLGKLPYRSFKALSEKYGPLMLVHIGSNPTVVISSPEIAQEITKNHDVAFADRLQTVGSKVIFHQGKDIAFAQLGDYWKQMKKISVTEILSIKRVQEFQYVREEETAKAMDKIRQSCKEGEALDLTDLLGTVSNNIISRSALGQLFENKDGGDSGGELVKQAIDLAGAVCFADTIPVLRFLDYFSGFNAHLKRVSQQLERFLDRVIDEHEQASKNDVVKNRKDIVDLLLHLQKTGAFEVEVTRENLRAILMDVFLGGTDTAATTMEWTMSQLIKSPRIMKKAQEEVRRVVGKKSKIDEADFNQMTYLRCVIKETLRFYLSPLIPRRTSMDVTLNGYHIPKGTNVMLNAWAIHRDAKEWVRPEEFLPERFIDNSVDFRGQFSKFIPFGTGRRVCPGINFAMKEVEFVVANLLHYFDWKLPDGAAAEDLDMSEVYTLAIRRKEPLRAVPIMHAT